MGKESNDLSRYTFTAPQWMGDLVDKYQQDLCSERRTDGGWATVTDALRSLIAAGLEAKGYKIGSEEAA